MATIHPSTLVHMPGKRHARPGKPSIPLDEAERVRSAMNQLYKERFKENKAAMADALGISSPALGKLLSPDGNRPSIATIAAVAELMGIDEIALRRGEMPRSSEIDDITIAVRYWKGRWSEADIAKARSCAAAGERHDPHGWTLRMDEIKETRLAKRKKN